MMIKCEDVGHAYNPDDLDRVCLRCKEIKMTEKNDASMPDEIYAWDNSCCEGHNGWSEDACPHSYGVRYIRADKPQAAEVQEALDDLDTLMHIMEEHCLSNDIDMPDDEDDQIIQCCLKTIRRVIKSEQKP